MNIMASRHSEIQNSVPHPLEDGKQLYITPDTVLFVDDSVVQQEKLPSNTVSIEPIKMVFELDKNNVLKLCPHLKENVLSPSHFERRTSP